MDNGQYFNSYLGLNNIYSNFIIFISKCEILYKNILKFKNL